MRLAATLLLIPAILLNSIESICAEPKTLEDLFPKYNGIMPAVEAFVYSHQIPNFEIFEGHHRNTSDFVFSKRNHIIFGQIWHDSIIDLSHLFNMWNVYIVFDTDINQWINVPRSLARRLGAGRRSAFVLARDEVAAEHKLISKNPADRKAHLRACNHANSEADVVEERQTYLLSGNPTLQNERIIAIKEKYTQVYTREFTVHSMRRGEYNVDGRKEMPT